MMKNKKMIMVFMLIIAFLFVMITCTQATGDGGLVVTPVNNEQGNNNAATNNEQNNTNTNNNNSTGNNAANNNATNESKLPQTGVEENTVLLFVFIAVAVASAVYAYVKIRKYNKI